MDPLKFYLCFVAAVVLIAATSLVTDRNATAWWHTELVARGYGHYLPDHSFEWEKPHAR